jgi:hypothetical protein
MLERVDLALASRMVGSAVAGEPLAAAQRVLDGVRRPTPGDAPFLASLLRLRGFLVDDSDAEDVVLGRDGRFTAITQEHRLLRGLKECLRLVRARATDGIAPDGWFLVDLFRTMTTELPRFRNNDLRRGAPWDAQLQLRYPGPEELRYLLDTFDHDRSYRDVPMLFRSLHPVRQGFRILWRFARIAPFPDFNLVLAWLAMNSWLQAKGFPLMVSQPGDQQLLARFVSGPPPTKCAPLEARLLAAFEDAA